MNDGQAPSRTATVPPVAIVAAGMMTGVGLTWASSCAAIRCAIDNFQETRFMGAGGEWIVGSEVPLGQPYRGLAKLAKLAAGPLRECLEAVPGVSPERIPLFLCIAEQERPGRLNGLEDELLADVEAELGVKFDPERSGLIARGRVGGVHAVQHTRKLLHSGADAPSHVLIAGVDSYLVGPTLTALAETDRLLSAANSDGFVPGEAGAAMLLTRSEYAGDASLSCLGIGFGSEEATILSEDKPLRADGLAAAIRAALDEAGLTMGAVDYRLSDVNGEQYGFKEAALAMTRLLRDRKEEFDIWHPADCIGEVGAAALPCMIGVELAAVRKRYAPGRLALHHLGADGVRRGALLVAAGGHA